MAAQSSNIADQAQHIADGATKLAKVSGIGAGASPFVSWMVENSEAIIVFAGLFGAVVSALSWLTSIYFNRKRLNLLRIQIEQQTQTTDNQGMN